MEIILVWLLLPECAVMMTDETPFRFKLKVGSSKRILTRDGSIPTRLTAR